MTTNLTSLPRFTISVLCCNRLDLTKQCLASVMRHSRDFELIVTDNASDDGTDVYLEQVKRQLGGRVRVVTNSVNLGFKDPNNHALTLANGEFFVLLNNDMTVCEGWLERLAEPFKADPKMAVTGIADTCGTISDKLVGVKGAKLEYIEGSCLMTPTALARKHGLFPDYLRFIYWEDTAYSLRMRELGYNIATVKLPINHNKRSQTITKVLTQAEIKGHLDYNTKAMKERWGFYFKRRTFDRRVLVRRLGAHGDVLLATPALRALRVKYPQAVIEVETKCPSMLAGLDWVQVATHGRNWFDEFYDLDPEVGGYEPHPEKHVVQAFADSLGVRVGTRWQMEMVASEVEEAWAERVTRGRRVALLHPGVSCWPGKNWPVERFEEVAGWLAERGYLTMTVGDRATPQVGTQLHLAGETTPQGLYALAKRAALFIGIDSMPQHVASAADTPSVVLYGPTNPRVLVRPTPRIVTVQADVREVPCVGEHGRRTKAVTQCPCDGACMKAVTVEMVMKAVERVERLTA